MTRFGSFFGETDNQARIVSNSGRVTPPDPITTGSIQPQPAYRPVAVTSSALPPAPGATVNNGPYVRPAASGTALLPPPPSADATASAAPASPGWSPTSGTQITIREGETVPVIARRYGVSEQALMKANGLGPNARLAGGQTLVIPAYNAAAVPAAAAPVVAPAVPAATASAAPLPVGSNILGQLPPTRPSMPQAPREPVANAVASAAGGTSGTYVVKAGDSLGKIAGSLGVRSSDLASANGMTADQSIRIGQTLKIPASPSSSAKFAMATPTSAADASPMPLPTSVPKAPKIAPAAALSTAPAVVAPTAQAAAPAVAAPSVPKMDASATADDATADAAPEGNFRWPVRGRVISGYGVKPGGDRNDGINIEVPEGTPIKAAEGGQVIYAGNELKGFGNLVLVKHPNGFVSAYAHASEILVRRGDQIIRGQTIAKVGATGNVTRPQLHFEIRNGNRPVDPIPYLSG